MSTTPIVVLEFQLPAFSNDMVRTFAIVTKLLRELIRIRRELIRMTSFVRSCQNIISVIVFDYKLKMWRRVSSDSNSDMVALTVGREPLCIIEAQTGSYECVSAMRNCITRRLSRYLKKNINILSIFE